MEEAQHAKLDTLMVEALAEGRGASEIESAVEEYIEIGGFLDGGVRMETQLDMERFMRASGRKLTEGECEEVIQVQHQSNRWTYLGSGMTHPNFLATLENLRPKRESASNKSRQLFADARDDGFLSSIFHLKSAIRQVRGLRDGEESADIKRREKYDEWKYQWSKCRSVVLDDQRDQGEPRIGEVQIPREQSVDQWRSQPDKHQRFLRRRPGRHDAQTDFRVR